MAKRSFGFACCLARWPSPLASRQKDSAARMRRRALAYGFHPGTDALLLSSAESLARRALISVPPRIGGTGDIAGVWGPYCLAKGLWRPWRESEHRCEATPDRPCRAGVAGRIAPCNPKSRTGRQPGRARRGRTQPRFDRDRPGNHQHRMCQAMPRSCAGCRSRWPYIGLRILLEPCSKPCA